MIMAENRLNREAEQRETTARKRSWVRPEVLPSPNPEPGYTYHWVRVSIRGEADPQNTSMKLREGWEPVKASDHPEIALPGVENERFKDNVVMGGLMLCKMPTEMVKERNAYVEQISESQIRSVDNQLMRENNPRMPLFAERKSTTTFGKG
jgi:hypothetical protein